MPSNARGFTRTQSMFDDAGDIDLFMIRSKRIGILGLTIACVLGLSLYATALPLQTKTPAHEKPDWEDKIVPSSDVTVLDLARRMIPDIKEDPAKLEKMTASDLSGVRLMDGVEETGMEVDLSSGDQCEISDPDYFWMKDGGAKLLLLLLKVNIEGAVIGLFKISPEVTLLDAATIAQDVHVDLDLEKLWTIHPQHQAFMVQCWHDNSSESFDSYTFVSVVNRKLRAVAGPVLSSGFAAYSSARERICKTSMTPKFQFVRSAGRAYFDLIDSETTLKVCHRNSEQWSWKTGVVYRKTVRRVWRWSPTKKGYRKVSTGTQANK